MADDGPEELAAELERVAQELEHRSEQLREKTGDVRQDWERKRSDSNVPGAPPRKAGGEEPEAEFPAKSDSLEDEDDS
jgi:hypothetical protein